MLDDDPNRRTGQFVYECQSCGAWMEVEDQLQECPECGGTLQHEESPQQ